MPYAVILTRVPHNHDPKRCSAPSLACPREPFAYPIGLKSAAVAKWARIYESLTEKALIAGGTNAASPCTRPIGHRHRRPFTPQEIAVKAKNLWRTDRQ